MPMQFLLRMRDLYPQFAQQQPPNSGMYMQQDAEECWTQLLYSLKEALQVLPPPHPPPPRGTTDTLKTPCNLVGCQCIMANLGIFSM